MRKASVGESDLSVKTAIFLLKAKNPEKFD